MTFGRQTDEKTAFSIMDEAWDAGVRLLDCADIYPLGGGVKWRVKQSASLANG